ncbi:MAG: presenilin family intramembrane aspartyl protease [Candidatus Nanoarchaeia archaeon]
MKHTLQVTILLIVLFLIAQFIGLLIMKPYTVEEKPLPLGIQRPEIEEKTSFVWIFAIIIGATIFALFLAKMEANIIWKLWFFVSVIFTLSIAFSSFMHQLIALALAVILAIFKVFKPNLIIHNLTELFIYGGLAAIFVPIMGILSVSLLLLIISVYDYIAVRKTKHMISLAKFQAKLKVFAGLLIPYGKHKEAILGGGDIGFPIIFAGVALKTVGVKAAIIPFFAAAALAFLLFKSEKKKFYPAMPIITLGCFVGYIVTLII